MNRKYRKYCFSLLAILLGFGLAGCNNDYSNITALYDGFQDPPNEAKPYVYYALLNGYLNREFAGEELEAYAEKGVGGLLVFDMGIIGKEQFFPPAGPEFMSDEWLDNFSYIVQKAEELGMKVELAACSSWDMGGSWVKPEEAVMALYQNSVTVTGPAKIREVLKIPELPETALLDEAGKPVVLEEVALLAIPVKKRQPAYEFVFKLGRDSLHTLDYFILTNGERLFSKDFSISVSESDPKSSSFREILRGSLDANTAQQRFDIEETKARFIRLLIYSGYSADADSLQLAEFEAYSTSGENLVYRPHNKRFDGGMMMRYNSQAGSEKKWRAKNINDGVYSGNNGTWISNGKPPVLVEEVGSIRIITDRLKDGVLEWDVPEGEWEIIRYVMTNTGEKLKIPNPASDGLATDHLSASATRNHIKFMTGKLKEKLGKLDQSPVTNLYLPSYEVRGMIWTGNMLDQFKKYRHYDMTRYLPVLNGYVIGDEETTERFLYDYQKTTGDILVDAFYITANETAREEGMAIKAESAGPGPPVHLVPVEALKALKAVEEMQGEFWPWREHWDALWVVKEIAAAAHVYGRKLVHMEAFTGFRHWMDGPVDLKPSADRAFCEGMNHVVWHMAEHNPPEAGKPGWVYHAGSHFNVNLVWWDQMKPWLDYLARSSFLLQQGLFVGDVVYYYGDKGANFIPPKHTNRSLDFGYDYDVTNLEVMLTRMDVKDYKIVLPDGMSYEVLVLPNQDDITLAALQRIEELALKGATILGPKPLKSTGLHQYVENDVAVQKLAAKLWDNVDGTSVQENRYGKGKIISGKTINEVLTERGVKLDFQFNSSDKNTELDFIHRRTAQEEIYFIRNKKNLPAAFNATFRVNGKTPELWFPDSGDRISQLVYKEAEGVISFDMNLDRFGSVFVVFTSDEPGIHANRTAGEYRVLEVAGPWTIFFNSGWGAPDSVNTDELISLSEFDDQGINYYSGIACYHNSFVIPEAHLGEKNRLFLDLGHLWLLADVKLNGKHIGTLWKPPYRIEITDMIKPGKNRLEIDIANTWCNRLIGDARHPDKKQYCRTNIGGNETTEAASWADTTLRKSGLFGPVRVVWAVDKTIDPIE